MPKTQAMQHEKRVLGSGVMAKARLVDGLLDGTEFETARFGTTLCRAIAVPVADRFAYYVWDDNEDSLEYHFSGWRTTPSTVQHSQAPFGRRN